MGTSVSSEVRRPIDKDVSVVIGFKDWGLDRLELAVGTLLDSFGDLDGEVIVSDYGSRDCPSARDAVERLGARHVYTETDGVWSRSRALNAGFVESRGQTLVSTDADMLFTPRAIETIAGRILADPGEALVLQCRDLPTGYDSAHVRRHGFTWDVYEEMSTLRPRWGMGGMMAVSREAFLGVRGFDERMHTYGGEDLDFAQRIRRLGCRVSWVENPRVRMYHMWHPSSRTTASDTAAGRAAIEFNRDIYLNDRSFVRNTTEWRHRPPDAAPAASVVIVTRNRAEYLEESVRSALTQTVRDVEVIVVDDGSTDATAQKMKSVSDPRLRYLRKEAGGIAAARNFAALHTRSRYTVIQDDDDIMLPDRVENHLQALEGGDSGTYGGWVDWNQEDGSIASVNSGRSFSLEELLFAPGVFLHPTLMIESRLIRQVGYDERFTSGSDYNLALRLARLGVRLRHTGAVHLLRRLHGSQVTKVDSGSQQSAARWTVAATLGQIPLERHDSLRKAALSRPSPLPPLSLDEAATLSAPYLPDRLVGRDVHVVLPPSVSTPPALRTRITLLDVTDGRSAQPLLRCGVLLDASWQDMAALCGVGAMLTVIRSFPRGRTPVRETLELLDHCRLVASHRLAWYGGRVLHLVPGPPDQQDEHQGLAIAHWCSGDREVHVRVLTGDPAAAGAPDPVVGESVAPQPRRHPDMRPEAVAVRGLWRARATDVPPDTRAVPAGGRPPRPRKKATADEQALRRRLRSTRSALSQAQSERDEAVRQFEEMLSQRPALFLARRALRRLSGTGPSTRRWMALLALALIAMLAASVYTALTNDGALLLTMTVGLVALALVVGLISVRMISSDRSRSSVETRGAASVEPGRGIPVPEAPRHVPSALSLGPAGVPHRRARGGVTAAPDASHPGARASIDLVEPSSAVTDQDGTRSSPDGSRVAEGDGRRARAAESG